MIPWCDWLSFALGILRWPPDAVWRSTPRELRAAARAVFGPAAPPLNRARLEELMALHPDGRR
ncbi:MAG: phage tail assembly chaperone [Blastochloris sp.]|nr:phage tail assembly chaperone [Blastochloris sp.]